MAMYLERVLLQAGAGTPETSEEVYSNTIPIISIFVILVLGLAGSLIPPLCQIYFPKIKLSERHGFRFFNGMAAGLVLGVGYIHSLPDAIESFDEAYGEYDSKAAGYAWGGFCAMIGSLLTFFGEEFVDRHLSLFGVMHGHHHHHHGVKEIKGLGDDEKLQDGLASTVEISKEELQKEKEVGYYTELYVLLFGLTFHSLFVGIALGVAGEDVSLFVAILFHQFFEGLALGARVARANFKSKAHVWFLDLVYSLSAPIGIAIGIGIESALEDSSKTYSTVNGIFQGLSAGILIYVALIHMMREEMSREEYKQGGKVIYVLYTGFLLGAGAMAVIGIWA